jgi:hypothetical protein
LSKLIGHPKAPDRICGQELIYYATILLRKTPVLTVKICKYQKLIHKMDSMQYMQNVVRMLINNKTIKKF